MSDLVERIGSATIVERSPVHARVTGTFLRDDSISLNNRYYSAATVEKVVTKAQARLADPHGKPIQVLDRHVTAEADESLKVIGKVTRVWRDGDRARYEADIPATGAGRDYATLVKGGFISTVSLRADSGSAVMEKGKLGDRDLDFVMDFDLGGIDATLSPGLADARVDSIHVFESVDLTKVEPILTETLHGDAEWARSWYETLNQAATMGELDNVTIDVLARDYLPLFEKTFEKPGHYTKKDREKIPAADYAGPHGSFPIVTQADVHDAAGLVGHADNPAAVKRRIIAIAKRKGFSLPAAWQSDTKKESTMPDVQVAEAAVTPPIAEAAVPVENVSEKTAAAAPERSKVEIVTEVLTNFRQALKECRLSDGELASAVQAAMAVDDNADSLLQILGVSDAESHRPSPMDRLVEQVASLTGQLTEKGAAISSTNRGHLNKAHDAVSTVLGMECAPGATDANKESTRIRTIVEQVLREAQPKGRTVETVQRVERAPQAAADPLTTLAGLVTQLAEATVATSRKVDELAETLPKAAAEAAAKQAWRPDRKTVIVENRDSASDSVVEKLTDRTIPVELRIKLMSDALMASLVNAGDEGDAAPPT